jgi:hypothetical protein
VDDLVQFLRARLDEDEQAARALVDDRRPGRTERWEFCDDGAIRDTGAHRSLRVKFTWPQEAAHIARHDPARVLAEVEAKRRILVDVLPTMQADEIRIAGEWGVGSEPVREASDDLLSLLALPYASHPDYREEWRP